MKRMLLSAAIHGPHCAPCPPKHTPSAPFPLTLQNLQPHARLAWQAALVGRMRSHTALWCFQASQRM